MYSGDMMTVNVNLSGLPVSVADELVAQEGFHCNLKIMFIFLTFSAGHRCSQRPGSSRQRSTPCRFAVYRPAFRVSTKFIAASTFLHVFIRSFSSTGNLT